MAISLRPEQPEDDEFLFRLYAGTRAAEMALAPWSEPRKEAFLRSQFQLQRTHYRRYYAEARFDVIQDGEEPIGRQYVFRAAGEIRLMDIALVPERRNQGLGEALIRQLLAEAGASGRSVTLHVELDNPAQRLYRRLGFREAEVNGPYVRMEWRPGSAAPQAPPDHHRAQSGA
jgi:ribosomal protein S18 acetylase RimI-like enzyme